MLLAGGCSGTPQAARIHHVVLLKLVDSAEVGELQRACDTALGDLPVVRGYWSGPPLETGRANVDGDYDLALHIGLASAADYDAYIAHPDHQALIAEWRDRLEWIKIYDVTEKGESPATSGSRSTASR